MVDSAIRFWEPCRLIYNLVMGVIVLCLAAMTWTNLTREELPWLIMSLFVLAVIANVLYCAAYVVDLFVQSSSMRPIWLKMRWLLLVIGIAFSAVITLVICLDLFPIFGGTDGF